MIIIHRDGCSTDGAQPALAFIAIIATDTATAAPAVPIASGRSPSIRTMPKTTLTTKNRKRLGPDATQIDVLHPMPTAAHMRSPGTTSTAKARRKATTKETITSSPRYSHHQDRSAKSGDSWPPARNPMPGRGPTPQQTPQHPAPSRAEATGNEETGVSIQAN